MSRLVLVPTPVGNLGDISFRAIETLKQADVILAEDTRVTRKLLAHYSITTPLQAFHQHNEHRQTAGIVERILSGQQLVLVSDAGTPGISDPAFFLVRACVEAGVEVECLPGATAFVPAVVVSGLPCDRFVFEGFLPHKKGRQKRLEALVEEERSIVFYESPYRLIKLLSQIKDVFGGERKVSVSREISKLYEQHVRGSVDEALAHFTAHEPKGEFVVVLAGKPSSKAQNNDADED